MCAHRSGPRGGGWGSRTLSPPPPTRGADAGQGGGGGGGPSSCPFPDSSRRLGKRVGVGRGGGGACPPGKRDPGGRQEGAPCGGTDAAPGGWGLPRGRPAPQTVRHSDGRRTGRTDIHRRYAGVFRSPALQRGHGGRPSPLGLGPGQHWIWGPCRAGPATPPASVRYCPQSLTPPPSPNTRSRAWYTPPQQHPLVPHNRWNKVAEFSGHARDA